VSYSVLSLCFLSRLLVNSYSVGVFEEKNLEGDHEAAGYVTS